MNRKAASVAMGAGIAVGTIVPNLDYFLAICDGVGEAMAEKAKVDASRMKG